MLKDEHIEFSTNGLEKLKGDAKGSEFTMPFTGHKPEDLLQALNSINESGMPVEIFDAFLAEYCRSKDLIEARFFAQCEWDC